MYKYYCEKCLTDFNIKGTDPCSKCGSSTKITKLENQFYKYAEECNKCKHMCYLGIPLSLNSEESGIYGASTKQGTPSLCALCK